VRDVIPRAGNFAPRGLWVPGAQFLRQPLHRFAHHLNQPLAQHLLAPVGAKFLSGHRIPQLDRLVTQVEELPQRQFWVMRAHTR
jgi:hypothetical protein